MDFPPTPGKHIDGNSPRGYYLEHALWADPLGRRDEAGLPVFSTDDGGAVYSPEDVARTALGNLEVYLANGSPLRRARFEEGARWLMANAEEIPGSFIGWPMPRVPGAFREQLPEGWSIYGLTGELTERMGRPVDVVLLGRSRLAGKIRREGEAWTL